MTFSTTSFPLKDIPGFNPLVRDYLDEKDSLQRLYQYDFNLESFAKIIEDKSKDTTDRNTLVSVLKRQYEAIATSQIVTENIHSLLSEKTFTVTAAHQPCLFMGPLFNIYKISCAINLSIQLKEKYPAYHFVPVFWMGSEDHDFEELNHIFINGKKIAWQQDNTAGAIGRVATASLLPVIEELSSMIGTSDTGVRLLETLRKGVQDYQTFGQLTQFFVHELFQEHGLVVIDQDDAELKKLFQAVIVDEVFHQRASEVLKQNLDFISQEYKVQANPREINFFYLSENSRARIVRTDKGFGVHGKEFSFSEEEMKAEIEAHPERFSPNVILRPLYQEMILPNLAFVGGAGELSYWLQLKPVFDYYKVNFPSLVMRTSITQINAATARRLSKLNLQPSVFFGDIEKLITDYTKSNATIEISLANERGKLSAIFDEIVEKAAQIDVTLRNNVSGEKQKLVNVLEGLEGKMLKAEKRKQEETIAQIKAVHASLFPNGNWQERVDSFIPNYISDEKEFINAIVALANPFQKAMLFLNQDHTSGS